MFLFAPKWKGKVNPMESSNQFLGTERIGKLMQKYAIPCIISLLLGALYNIVDQIFIANASYLGSYGNAANTVVFPLTVVALAIAVMIGDGCCAFVSISLGQNEVPKAKRSVGNAVVMCLVSSIVLAALYLIFEDLLHFHGRHAMEREAVGTNIHAVRHLHRAGPASDRDGQGHQRCRFGDKLDMELEMENEDLLEARMPKLILQPLAENSVMHGSSDDGSVMKIHITCWEEDGHMILELQDDGKGFEITRTDLNPHKDRKKIGVANVNDRIQLNFGREYGLKIDSHPGKGTTCTLTLPKLYADTLSQQPEE